jgi:hypothetical protein
MWIKPSEAEALRGLIGRHPGKYLKVKQHRRKLTVTVCEPGPLGWVEDRFTLDPPTPQPKPASKRRLSILH